MTQEHTASKRASVLLYDVEYEMRFDMGAALAIALAIAPQVSLAGDYEAGDLTIADPHARATAPNAPTGAGYMMITNSGSTPDRLVAGAVDFADKVEVHEVSMEDNVMRMREVEGGIEIAPGASVHLRPGGYHLMFIGLKETLVEGEKRPATVTFENAGDVAIDLEVRKVGGGHMSHGG